MKRLVWGLIAAFIGVVPMETQAFCPWNSQDLNSDGHNSVVDVQCSILTVLAQKEATVSMPECFNSSPHMDLDCDQKWTVVDVLCVVQHSLGNPMDPIIDQNGDNCADACQADSNANGVMDWLECSPEDELTGVDVPEVCDGVDNNCDGQIDEGFPLGDLCTVGVGSCETVGEWGCVPGGVDPVCMVEMPEVPPSCDDGNPCTVNDTCGVNVVSGEWSCGGSEVVCDSPFETCSDGFCLSNQVEIPSTQSGLSFQAGVCEGCHYPEIPSDANVETLFGASPQHPVYLSYDYKIDQTEVTNRQFVTFLNALGITEDNVDSACDGAHCFDQDENDNLDFDDGDEDEVELWSFEEGTGDFPVHWVTWAGANAFCESMGRRLCTDYEWGFAAGGTVGTEFPWGDVAPNCNNNYASLPECDEWPEPVGSHPMGVSPFGVLDMVGSASEYTSTFYYSDYHCNRENSVCDGLLPADCEVNCFGAPVPTEVLVDPTGMPSGSARTIRSPVKYLPYFIAHQTFLRFPVSEDSVAHPEVTKGMDFDYARGIRCCDD